MLIKKNWKFGQQFPHIFAKSKKTRLESNRNNFREKQKKFNFLMSKILH